MGVSVRATKLENITAAATATPNSLNKRPVVPSRNEMGINTAIRTIVVAITAKATCFAPRLAAKSAGSPASIRRWIFSKTTIASSTTSPIARTSANSVSTLTE